MSAISIQGETFKIGDQIDALKFNALVLDRKEKNSYAEYCQTATSQIDTIEECLSPQYEEAVRELKHENSEMKAKLESTEEDNKKLTELMENNEHLSLHNEDLQSQLNENEECIHNLETETETLRHQITALTEQMNESVQVDFFETYGEKVSEVIGMIESASDEIISVNQDIETMSQNRITVLEKMKNSQIIKNDPGVTDLRHEKSEVANFQNLLQQMADKKDRLRTLPTQINGILEELRNIWKDSDNEQLRAFGEQQHLLLKSTVRWKLELEPQVFD